MKKTKKVVKTPPKQKYSVVTTPLTVQQFDVISAPTPQSELRKRPGSGGKEFTYVRGAYVKQRLNKLFGGLWSFEIDNERVVEKQVIVRGRLIVPLKNGKTIIKTQYGRATNNSGDWGNTFKSAGTDCLKKCASELGICSDVYAIEEDKLDDETQGRKKLVTIIEKYPEVKAWAKKNNINPASITEQEAQEIVAKLLNK